MINTKLTKYSLMTQDKTWVPADADKIKKIK